MERFHDLFSSAADIREHFEAPEEGFPTDADIIYAYYSYADSSGYAYVLYKQDGKLYEVYGAHCSCNGLECQWVPEETSIAAIRMRRYLSEDLKAVLDHDFPS